MFEDAYWIYSVGLLAQVLFSARLLVQWLVSEKAKKVVTPQLFWQLSLIASFLLLVYGFLRNDFAIILGQLITYGIYIYNLKLQGNWQKVPKGFRAMSYVLPCLIIGYLAVDFDTHWSKLFDNRDISSSLLMWGVFGQVLFTFRFVYQWVFAVRTKEAKLPLGFWLISLLGSVSIISYALFREDPVLILGQSFGFLVYARNLWLIRKERVETTV